MGLRIAITGGMGAGKSLAAGWLRAAGWPVVDADEAGREVVEGEAALRPLLEEAFGPGLWNGGRLERAELGRRAFATDESAARLNALVFPYLWAALEAKLASLDGELAFLDAALVHEWGVAHRFDEVWLVRARPEIRLARAAARLGRPVEELGARLARQLDPEAAARAAHFVMDNDGPPGVLWDQLHQRLIFMGFKGLPIDTRPA